MRTVVAFGFLVLQCVAAIAPVRDVESQIPVGANQARPGFYGGYAFFVERPDFVKLYSPDGKFVLATPVATDMHASVIGVAVDSDGTMAVGYTSTAWVESSCWTAAAINSAPSAPENTFQAISL